jgi:nucleoid-associated protein YgaU
VSRDLRTSGRDRDRRGARGLKIFLSYATAQRAAADDIAHRVQAAGHDVFFDREDLPPGQSYDDRIRGAIEGCDLFVFLVAPESVASGHYTRTELKIASRRWPTPGWHVLPVEVAPTPLADVPAYLRALTILQPEGNTAAEVLLEVDDRLRAQSAAVEAAPVAPAEPLTDDAAPRYRSLRLRFLRSAGGEFEIVGTGPDGGASAPGPWLFDASAAETMLWAGATAIDGTARRAGAGGLPDALLPAAARTRQIGGQLFEALRQSASWPALEQGLRAIDPQRGEGLRVVIDTTDAPELARLPWEFVYIPAKDDFLFSDRMKPVVRWLEVDEPLPTLRVEPPLRLLIAIASPAGQPGLEVGAELAQLDTALEELAAAGGVRTVRLAHTTLERLDEALLRERPHVLHFIGHGDFDGDEGAIVLESEPPVIAPDPISGRRLAVLLRNHLATLRLVYLNSCVGAAASHIDPFAGVAQSLIRRGVPAVIAMQFPVPDAAAIALARHFYRYLAAGQPVDAALTSARAFMVARGYEVEWGAPALYMRSPDGRLFDVVGAPHPPALPTPAAAAGAPPSAPKSAEFSVFVATRPPAIAIDTVIDAETEATLLRRHDIQDDLEPGIESATEAAPGAPPPREERAAASASPSDRSVEAPRRARLPVPLVLVAVLTFGLAAFALIWLLQRAAAPPLTDHLPAPVPAPAPAAAPPTVAEGASGPALASSAITALQAGDAAGALQTLKAARALDPQALAASRLGPMHAPLARALALAAQQAFTRGDTASGRALAGEIDHLGPLDPALGEQLRRQLQPWLATAAASTPAGGVAAGPPTRYLVRDGDTLWSIAARLTGDGRRWPALVQAQNRAADAGQAERIVDPDRIRPGLRLVLPSSALGDGAIEYHVAARESLWRIAWRIYGQGAQWQTLAAANKLVEPYRIVTGQVLRVPLPAR